MLKKIYSSPYFIIFLALVVCYFPVFFIHPLKWDIIDIDLPMRFFTTDCIQNGIFPLWNPYQYCGFPIYTTPINWYPIAWIIGILTGYNLFGITIDFLLHIYLAGIGFYILSRKMGYENSVSIVLSICYMACGFMIGNAQHFGWIIAATWTPFIIAYFIDFSRNTNISAFLKIVFFSYLLITGGYPAISIILCYLLAVIMIYFAVIQYKNNGIKKSFAYIGHTFLLFLAIIITSAIVFIAMLDIYPEISRLSGMSIDKVLRGPFTTASLVSILFPYGTAIHDATEILGTDFSMANIYFGLFGLLFLIYAWFTKTNTLQKIFFFFGLFSLFASMHLIFPIRIWLYKWIPFMDVFRYSSVFRFFTILGFLLFAGEAMQRFVKDTINKKLLYIISGFLMLICLFMILIATVWKAGMQLWHQSAIQAGIQIGLLIIFSLSVLNKKVKIKSKMLLILFVFIDMGIASGLNGNATVYSKDVPYKEVKASADTFVRGFPIPQMNPVIETKQQPFFYFWRNTNTLNKTISFEGYTPYFFSSYADLANQKLQLFENTLNNPFLFLSAAIKPMDMISDTLLYHHKNIYVEIDDYQKYSQKTTSYNDCMQLIAFQPNKIDIEVEHTEPLMLMLLQNKFKGWHAYIDHEEVSILRANQCFMAVEIPAGSHKITFCYTNNSIKIIALITAVLLLTLLVFLFIDYYKRNYNIQGK